MDRRPKRRALDRALPEERSRALKGFESRLVERQAVPDVQRLLTRRFGWLLQLLTAVALGILIGSGSILFNFFLLTKLLHI